MQTGLFQCAYCGRFQEKITEDHIYPKSLGGTSITSACGDCNQAKEDMRPIEWAIFASINNIALGVGGSATKVARIAKTKKTRTNSSKK